MNVLYITHYARMYGANKSLMALMQDMKKRYNIHPILLVLDLSEEEDYLNLKYECELQGIDVIKVKYYTWQTSQDDYKFKDILKKILNFFLIRKILKELNEYSIDLVHTNSSVTHIGQIIADYFLIPHVWHIREFGKEDYKLRYIYNREYVNKTYQKADCNIAISNSIKSNITTISPKAKIHLIYNGLKSFKLDKVKEIHKTIEFCCVGVLSESKNQLEILKALKYLIDSDVKNLRINFIGDGDVQYKQLLEMYAKENNLCNYIKFWGYQEQIEEILKQMSIGIVPSIKEAFGRVTIEFMLAEMPVIGSNTGGTKEILENSRSGMLYSLNNPIQLAECMRKFINNPELIDSIGKIAREEAMAKYTLEANTDAIFQIYASLQII